MPRATGSSPWLGHQPVFDAREWQAVKVPEGVETEAAAFAYLPTLGLHALRRGGFTPGLNVAVIGLGLIGFGAALVADAIGAYLACLEISPARRRAGGGRATRERWSSIPPGTASRRR